LFFWASESERGREKEQVREQVREKETEAERAREREREREKWRERERWRTGERGHDFGSFGRSASLSACYFFLSGQKGGLLSLMCPLKEQGGQRS
jgi:hypothetical protein